MQCLKFLALQIFRAHGEGGGGKKNWGGGVK